MNLGTPLSELGWLRRLTFSLISRPSWMEIGDNAGLGWFLSSRRDLVKNGIVVPGTIIQANSNLFEPGDMDHPGELLFSLSPVTDAEFLLEVAHELYMLKGEHSHDHEESFFSQYLADEMERVQGVPVSEKICPVPKTFVSTTIFYRSHLPGGVLNSTLYPVLVSPKSLTAMVLPSALWSPEGWELYNGFQ